ncbi:MAG: diacylglycerol kinase family protein [Peptococcaceae bacterium]
MRKKAGFFTSFNFALQGIKYCVLKERNIRIHLALAAAALLLSWILGISPIEWVLVVAVITVVIALEMINTAIERTVDLFSPAYHPLAETAKNVAAGAVLIAALNAVVTGAVIFLPKLFAYFR